MNVYSDDRGKRLIDCLREPRITLNVIQFIQYEYLLLGSQIKDKIKSKTAQKKITIVN